MNKQYQILSLKENKRDTTTVSTYIEKIHVLTIHFEVYSVFTASQDHLDDVREPTKCLEHPIFDRYSPSAYASHD